MTRSRPFVRLGALLTLAALAGASSAQTASPLWGDLTPGPHAVGFRLLHTVDSTRHHEGRFGRPVQVAVWYPAQPVVQGQPLPYGAYVDFALTEAGASMPPMADRETHRDEWREALSERAGVHVDVDALFEMPTAAHQDARPAAGAFPLVLYGAGGRSEAFDNSVLAEYLASHGIAVVAVPSVGHDEHRTTIDPVGLEAEARDLEVALAIAARALPQIDPERLGVAGWSWGGLAAMLVQMRNPGIDAVLSLDGSIALHAEKAQASAFFDPAAIRVPLALLTSRARLPQVTRFLDTVRYADVHLVEAEVAHSDFSAYDFIARVIGEGGDDETAHRRAFYEFVCRYALALFQHTLSDGAPLSVTPETYGAPAGLVRIDRRPPLPLPPTQEAFFDRARGGDVDGAIQVFRDVRQRDPGYQIFEPMELTTVAWELYRAGRSDDALALSHLRIEATPDYLAYEWLANLQYRMGLRNDALQAFAIAYGMLLARTDRTAGLEDELDFYRRRMDELGPSQDATQNP